MDSILSCRPSPWKSGSTLARTYVHASAASAAAASASAVAVGSYACARRAVPLVDSPAACQRPSRAYVRAYVCADAYAEARKDARAASYGAAGSAASARGVVVVRCAGAAARR